MNQSSSSPPSGLRRLPGLFRRWELAQIIEAGRDYRIEDAGEAADGTVLYGGTRWRYEWPAGTIHRSRGRGPAGVAAG